MTDAIPTIAEAARLIAAKQLVAGRADPRLPRPRARARRPAARFCPSDRGARAWPRRAPPRRRSWRDGPKGPLHGIPIGLKDIVDTKGIPTTCQSKILADNIPDADAACAERLAAAGTVLIGQDDDARIRRWRAVVRSAVAAGAQPVEPGPFHRRQQQRHRRRGRGRADPGRHRHRYRRLDPRPGGVVRDRRDQADLWPCQPRRGRAGRVQPRPYRPDGLDRRGLRDDAAGLGRARSARPGQRLAAGARLRGASSAAGLRGSGSA